MDVKPRSLKKINDLLERGVDMPNPATIDIGDDVDISRISGKGVRIYPGCRIYGKETAISSDCRLGYEAPVTIENCQLAEKVELKGGFFSKSVFLEKSNMGMGAHVREGCILEEEAGGAHCVGLKQTILFPFVTLGSLINFCVCLMGGGTSRSNHSEVGSSYIHFNFTPDGDKATPSLLGDVPRGVMLNQPPIFLGGQGGIIGPVRLGFGNIVAAGSILKHDYPGNNQLIFEKAQAGSVKPFYPAAYPHLERIVENNIFYLANLKALEAWYTHVRKPFLETGEYGSLLYAGVMERLASVRKERLKRLNALAQKAAAAAEKTPSEAGARGRNELHKHMAHLEDIFNGKASPASGKTDRLRDTFLEDLESIAGKNKTNYIETIQMLPAGISSKGVMWLDSIIRGLGENVSEAVPALGSLKTFSQPICSRQGI